MFEGSDAKHAVSLGISSSQYSRIKNGDVERVLSEPQWISLARRLEVSLTDMPEWKAVRTPVYDYITTVLELCQTNVSSSLICDLSDIGKSYSVVRYQKSHRNVVYVDCSQVKHKQRLIRYIAKELGVGYTGSYANVYEDLVFYLKTIPHPLIILDEAGDLHYEAFLEIKALWNATELCCGFCMMGADGLAKKIQQGIDGRKVGYTEIFSRFGKRYLRVLPMSSEDRKKMMSDSAMMIIQANAPEGVDAGQVLRKCIGDDGLPSLRRIYKELTKMLIG